MTRETKIGLLIGLGFIVVFAVLLSHTGRVPPPGDGLDSVIAERARPGGGRVDGAPGSTTVFPEFSGDDRVRSADSPSYGMVQDTSARDEAEAPGLPRPGALDPP